MPWQLIYTSAPRGLLSGQSGFCTVARSGELREALAQRLEQISYYHYLRVAEVAVPDRNPTVCAFRILDLRGTKYYVLTRIQPCGLDFTARTNHLAHHLVLQSGEVGQLPSPANILRHWPGWLSNWQGEPRLLEDPSMQSLAASTKSCLPANTWLRVTGDAGRAAGLLEGECARGCYLLAPSDSERQVLEMFCESLQLLNFNGQFPLRPWRHPFTTFLQAEDNPSDFHWRACQENTPAHQEVLQRGAALVALRSIRVPANSLVKIAREGIKPAGPPPAAAPAQSKLALATPTPEKVATPSPIPADNPWLEPVNKSDKSKFLDVNLFLDSTSLVRIGIAVALILGLLAMKHFFFKKNPIVPLNPTMTESYPKSAAPITATQTESAPKQTAAPESLDALAGDGPTYVFATTNIEAFRLPIDSISRFQNLIQRFDHYDMHPGDIRISMTVGRWDSEAGETLTVNPRTTQELSAQAPSGAKCAFNYSDWQAKSANTLAVQTSFAETPGAFSVQFSFPASAGGDPFRLLIVNESNAPAPLHLSLQWLTTRRAALDQFRSGDFTLLENRRWQFKPFIDTHYLYKDWPAGEAPSLGNELDFVAVEARLAVFQRSFEAKMASLGRKMEKQKEQAVWEIPLGTDIGLTNGKFASLVSFEPDPNPRDFIAYLNKLSKQTKIEHWPHVSTNDAENDLAGKFEQIYDLCVEKNPDTKTSLTVGNTNYFYAVWQNLKDVDKIRQERQRVQADLDRIQDRIAAVPSGLDKVSSVGLFIVDPPAPGLEMIQFEGP